MRSRLSVSKDVVGQVLNHAPQGVTQIHYASAPSLTDKRAALNKWDEYLQNLLYAERPDNVISFPVSKLAGES